MIKIFLIFFFTFINFCIAAQTTPVKYSFTPETFTLKIEQVTLSALSGKEKKTYGTMDYMHPGKFRYEQDRPENNKIIFVSDQNRSWFYTAPFLEGEPGDLIINPMKGKFSLSEFFSVLQNGLITNKSYTVENKDGVEHLVFNEKIAKEMGFTKAILSFKEGNILSFDKIKSVKIIKLDGSEVLFNLIEIKQNIQFSKDHFVFAPPPNTKINKQ